MVKGLKMKQHSPQFLKLVTEAKSRIKEISPKTLKEKIDNQEPFYLIDVREENEWPSGHIPTAIHLGKGIIERDIEKKIPDPQAQIVVYCSGGFRCALVADSLQKMGYKQVYSLETGSQGWIDAGYGLSK
jgi:rhodanese-related sulfurtransferase